MLAMSKADKVDNISVLNMLKPQNQAIRTDYLWPTILKGECNVCACTDG